ncbi:MAG: hypothetical protein WAT67_04415, partial [Candidatus Contendobacter sp.]
LATIHIYPTLAEANKYAAGVWKKAHVPAKLLAWLERFHAWRRGPDGQTRVETPRTHPSPGPKPIH